MGYRLALIGLLALPVLARAQEAPGAGAETEEIVDLRVRQVTHADSTLRIFFDARDAEGRAAADLDAARLSATVGSTSTPVRSVEPFDPGEGVAYVLLVDVSLSLRPGDFAAVRSALRAWVAGMNSADRLAIITFGTTVQVVQRFTDDAAALNAAIEGLKATDNLTHLYEGFQRALEVSRQAGADLPARRAIIVLSDGIDDAPGSVTRSEVLQTLAEGPVPIYAIGLVRPNSAAGLESLGVLARTSGGQLLRATSEPVGILYASVLQHIREALVAEVDCAACTFDGARRRVQLSLAEGSGHLSDGLDARLFPVAPDTAAQDSTAVEPETAADEERPSWWMWGALIGAGLLLVVVPVVVRRRRRREAEAVEEAPPSAAEPEAGVTVADAAETVALPPPGVVIEKSPAALGPSWVRLSLTPMQAQGEARVFTLRERATLGRAQGRADLAFPGDAAMSGEHALLQRQGVLALLYDAGSTNGTFVNGVPIQGAYALRDDDVIRMGNTELRVRLLGAG